MADNERLKTAKVHSSMPLQRAESAELNEFIGKVVAIKFFDGTTEIGILHKDTLATYTRNSKANNTKIRGYFIHCGTGGCLHFKKSHVKSIALVARDFKGGGGR